MLVYILFIQPVGLCDLNYTIMTIHNILVPTDFSECSKNALKGAAIIARKFNAKIYLLHAYTMPVMATDAGVHVLAGDVNDFEGDIKRHFKELHEDIRLLDDVETEDLLVCDFTKDAITESAEKYNIDLVVMGTVGAGGLEEILIGSNTYGIISENKFPLLAVPVDADLSQIQKIVFAGDYLKIPSESTVLGPLKAMSGKFGAEIHIVHIGEALVLDTEKSEQARKLDLEFKNLPHHYHFEVSDNVEAGINRYVDENGIDIVTVTHRHRRFIEKVFKTSWTKKMALHCYVPLLVLPEIHSDE
jgi:nucleotide-binding universal stress UspA family protein